jgi:hypothetical protein
MIASPGYHGYGVSEASSLSFFNFWLNSARARLNKSKIATKKKKKKKGLKKKVFFCFCSRQLYTVFFWEKYGLICRLSSSK